MSIGIVDILIVIAALAVVALIAWVIVAIVNKVKRNPGDQRPDPTVRG